MRSAFAQKCHRITFCFARRLSSQRYFHHATPTCTAYNTPFCLCRTPSDHPRSSCLSHPRAPAFQGPALRTLMQFVEIEPSLCVSAAKFSHPVGARGRGGAVEIAREGAVPGEGTVWGGLFSEVVRTIVLGPCSMQPKLLKSLGDDYVNVHDDVRCMRFFGASDTLFC